MVERYYGVVNHIRRLFQFINDQQGSARLEEGWGELFRVSTCHRGPLPPVVLSMSVNRGLPVGGEDQKLANMHAFEF